MKPLLQKLGVLAWWATLPALIVCLSGRPRTRVVVRSGDRIVVVKGWLGSGRWSLPGGGLHAGESPLAGALREVTEETGLVLLPKQVQSLGGQPYRNRGIHFLCHYFLADISEESPLRPEPLEISEVVWAPRTDLHVKTCNPDVLTGLQLAAGHPHNLLQ